MTITAQEFIKGRLESADLPTCAIVAHPTQANRWRLIPVSPLDSAQLSVVSYLFEDVCPHDDGAEITVPADYPPASPATREWLTPENTLARRLEQVLIDHGLIENVKDIGGVPGGLNYTVKFNGAAPGLPANMKRGDLAQAGLMEMKVGGSPGTWSIRVSDQWRIEQQAGELLRQRDAEIAELNGRLNALRSALDNAVDANVLLQADRDCARVDRDRAMSDVRALETQLLDAAAGIDPRPSLPKWTPLRSDIGYTMPRGCKLEIAVSLEHLNELLGLGGRMIGQPEFLDKSDLRVLVEMREGKAARLPNYAGRVTIVDTNRPYTMRRADRISRDNAKVIQGIHATPRTPVQPITPLEVRRDQ